ncbi:PhzF family phenazine biosynthesis isomerase [Lysinibacillus sphaericus]|uniref:PhzF family phenazine biosynthesis protein n=1 Tax=Lysinibacillus sphaericus TaxID=1421 RepID=UPI002163DA3B|nr:PhzF family phenazine biosynthesis isomerase [Lysinibacillus sphaericus]MCS1382016.1 PhzF family phenazine biosynthesis isomerase [Lysinibacillus sphaericus]
MQIVTVQHYDAFSTEPNKGNPAGVVVEGSQYSEQEMQEIAKMVGFNETAFALPSNQADIRIRYFTPGHEVDLCGHATMATIYALHTQGFLANKSSITIETKAGILSILLEEKEEKLYITMQHAAPQFVDFNGSKAALAQSIGLNEDELHAELPIVYGSTGLWTLLIPVQHLASFEKMSPQTATFPSILQEMPTASLHPFCLQAFDKSADMHARHFSSPYSGTIQDIVTGTASGVMGAYYAKYIDSEVLYPKTLVVEQGQELDRDGRVHVHVNKVDGELDISITGTAVYVKELKVQI